MKLALIHTPVLLTECIDYLNIKPDGKYVDCTLGRAGHALEILKRLDTGKIYCFDQDQSAIDESKDLLDKYKNKVFLIKSNFNKISEKLTELGINEVDGILYDLGVSSPQLDDDTRGFSYINNSSIDMRMDQSQSLTAWKIINHYSYQEIKKLIKVYGEEIYATNIAKNIVTSRAIKPIDSTEELVTIIKKSLPIKALKKQHHPAKKTFQALRIAVNDELANLEISLKQSLKLLKKNGRLVVISFHSLEDRIVKNIFKNINKHPEEAVYAKLPFNKEWTKKYKIITKKPVTPSNEEINNNPRARSAKLRAIEKV